MAKKEMTYAQAICNALDQEMAIDKNIVQLGEDISVADKIKFSMK